MFRQLLALLGSLFPYICAFVLALVVTMFALNSYFLAPVASDNPARVSFEVRKGSSIRQIAKDLEARNLVKSWYSIYLLSRVRDLGGQNPDSVVRQGEYSLAASQSPKEIFNALLKGDVIYHEILLREGETINDLVNKVDQTPLVTRDELERALRSPELLRKLGVNSESFEGYLMPETYRFSKPVSAEDIITEMVTLQKKRINDQIPQSVERILELQTTLHETLTLASIIEKETGKAEERPLIASVFHNRLRLKMPLQSDPTVIYGIPSFGGNLTKEHLKTPGPYNTYTSVGLPPTPICSPGIESLKAALYPETTDYLFFVGKGDGTHHFSNTYKEHQQAVRQYQLNQR